MVHSEARCGGAVEFFEKFYPIGAAFRLNYCDHFCLIKKIWLLRNEADFSGLCGRESRALQNRLWELSEN